MIEAGRGMGLTKRQALRHIELPLAVPVILAGVRTALVITVGMAALAYLIGGGGLGATISAGLKLSQRPGADHRCSHDCTRRVDGRLDRHADREDAQAQRPVNPTSAEAASARPRSNNEHLVNTNTVNTNKEKTQ